MVTATVHSHVAMMSWETSLHAISLHLSRITSHLLLTVTAAIHAWLWRVLVLHLSVSWLLVASITLTVLLLRVAVLTILLCLHHHLLHICLRIHLLHSLHVALHHSLVLWNHSQVWLFHAITRVSLCVHGHLLHLFLLLLLSFKLFFTCFLFCSFDLCFYLFFGIIFHFVVDHN